MGGMTNTNPPAKSGKLNQANALRTTMTHVQRGDMALVMTVTADPEGYWVPAPGVAPKRAVWAKVIDTHLGIQVELPNGDRETLDYTGHTAITIRDREISDAEESGPTVTVTGTTVHREARGVAWCPVPVLDGDEITSDATRVTCPVCVLADTVPAEVVADAVYSYEHDSYVVYVWDAAAGRSLPVPVAELGAHGNAATPDGLPTDDEIWDASMAEAMEQAIPTPLRVPGTLPQRQAVRLLVELEPSGATPQVNAGVMKRLQLDGWLTYHKATRTVTLAQMARDWVASEHEADYTSHTLESGAVVYSAICNCGPDQENPRLRRVPWMSSMLTTPEDAVAVALGHGEVSRPRYEAPSEIQDPCTCDRRDEHHYSGCPVLIAAFDGRTADGHKIIDGMPVWDYNVEAGYVDLSHLDSQGWFQVVKVRGDRRGSLMNAERVSTRHPRTRQLASDALTSVPEISVTDARITAVACGECGIMPHDMECRTGLRLESPTPRVDAAVSSMLAGEWRSSLTVEDLAGLLTAESATEAHNAARPWSAKGAKRKGSSVAVRRQRQRVGAR